MGVQGYPEISIAYFGRTADIAERVAVAYIDGAGVTPMEELFNSQSDARQDQVIQSVIVKMIERSKAKTIRQATDIEVVK
jgi:hypothetical protein